MIKVSIITPCLNSEKTIRAAIDSVLNQTYKNIEYIIVDGGSTDHTMEIIKEYYPKFHGRMKYVSEKDKGIYDAMNKGIKRSTGSLIGIIGSDDYYEKNAVEQVVAHMTSDKYQVIYGYCKVLKGDHVKFISKTNHEMLTQYMIPHATCFVSRNIYRDFGLFLLMFKIASDFEFMLRLYCSKKVTFIQIKEILADFRMGGTCSKKRCFLENVLILRKYKLISLNNMIMKVADLYL